MYVRWRLYSRRLQMMILEKNLARASMDKMTVEGMTKVEIGSEKKVDPWRRWRCYFPTVLLDEQSKLR
jgi:hypothetical protein